MPYVWGRGGVPLRFTNLAIWRVALRDDSSREGSRRWQKCYTCYGRCMPTSISHRDLRNRSGEVLHAVEAGEAYEVTSRGKPVARLVPITEAKSDLPLHRPAATHGGFSQMIRHSIAIPSSETIDDLRGER